jgi:hypothetical protein
VLAAWSFAISGGSALLTEQSPHQVYIGFGRRARRHKPIKQAIASRIGAGVKIGSAAILNGIDCGALFIGNGTGLSIPSNSPGELRALIDGLEEEDQKTERDAMVNVRPRLEKISDKDSAK